jgi:hypothetical protein
VKYKAIVATIHNFGHSFTSLMNYVDENYIVDDLSDIHRRGLDIEVDWLDGKFEPQSELTPRLRKSIGFWRGSLDSHLQRSGVERSALLSLKFCWPAKGRKYMVAIDDRKKEHKIFMNETK